MQIYKGSERIYLELTEREAKEAGLDYSSFGRGNKPTERFLSAVIELLRNKELLDRKSGKLDIEVAETDNGLSVSISSSIRVGTEVMIFSDPTDISQAASILGKYGKPYTELWKFSGGYAIIAESPRIDRQPQKKIQAAKIREYGSFLTDSLSEII